jgi:uncharacterized caspase-like protein
MAGLNNQRKVVSSSSFREELVRWYWQLFLALLLWCGTSPEALAEKRVALVIGNSTYVNVPRLPNPANDAPAVADLFKALHFDSVQLRLDSSIADLRRAVSDFADLAADADIAVVYYAGHGMEIDGNNYLVPIDAKLARDFDVDDEALSLDRVLRATEPARRLRLIILDACRDNPFLKTMKRSVGSRSIGRGLAKVEPAVSDTLIAFAARAGSIALDGGGHNSPFTSALLKHIATPGIDIRVAFGHVRDDVLETTGRKQEPFVYGSLGGKTISIANATPDSMPVVAKPDLAITDAAQAWAAAKDTTNREVLEEFIRQYGGSFYAALARARLKEIDAIRAEPEGTIHGVKRNVRTKTINREQEPSHVGKRERHRTRLASRERESPRARKMHTRNHPKPRGHGACLSYSGARVCARW